MGKGIAQVTAMASMLCGLWSSCTVASGMGSNEDAAVLSLLRKPSCKLTNQPLTTKIQFGQALKS